MTARKKRAIGDPVSATAPEAEAEQLEAVQLVEAEPQRDVPIADVAEAQPQEYPATIEPKSSRRSNLKVLAVVAAALLVLGTLGLASTQNVFGDPKGRPSGVGAVASHATTDQPYLGSTQGCVSSYWATPDHFSAWEEYLPDQSVGSVFVHARDNADMTLVAALAAPVSSEDARRALIREAVTAALNAANDSLAFPYARYNDGVDGRPPLVPTTNRLLTSGTDAEIAQFTSDLAAANALGCPL